MNHDAPRQRESDGRWDYTTFNPRSGSPWPIGYCRAYRPFSAEDIAVGTQEHADRLNAAREPFRAKYHTDGHATAAEACECYRQFLLDQKLRFHEDRAGADTLHRCEAGGCHEMTSGRGDIIGEIRGWHLCRDHRNRETVSELLTVGESWHS